MEILSSKEVPHVSLWREVMDTWVFCRASMPLQGDWIILNMSTLDLYLCITIYKPLKKVYVASCYHYFANLRQSLVYLCPCLCSWWNPMLKEARKHDYPENLLPTALESCANFPKTLLLRTMWWHFIANLKLNIKDWAPSHLGVQCVLLLPPPITTLSMR